MSLARLRRQLENRNPFLYDLKQLTFNRNVGLGNGQNMLLDIELPGLDISGNDRIRDVLRIRRS